jgi:DNA-binding NarL/FixJ family response regulator
MEGFSADYTIQVVPGQNQKVSTVRFLSRARVLLADDNHELLERVKSILASDFDVIGSAINGHDLLALAGVLLPDVVVADISMPGLNGIEAVRQLLANGSTAKCVFLTLHEDGAFVGACFAAGAMGYVLKRRTSTDLVIAIQEVLKGRRFVSPPLNH